MPRLEKLRGTAENRARFEAEDRANDYLAKLPPDVAFATALMVEFLLATKWAAEYHEILQRGENPEVFQLEDTFERMRTVRSLVPPDVEVDMIAMDDIRRLLTGLRADVKWYTASMIALRQAQVLLGRRQKLCDVLPEMEGGANEHVG